MSHEYGHAHHHGHRQGHSHNHAPSHYGRTFAIAILLNLTLVIAQVVYGIAANSLALLADAGHNFGDVMGLLMAWGAFAVADWRPSSRFTYRMRSASILSAFANAVILLVATGAIAWEAVQRFRQPEDVATSTVMAVAAGAVVINGVSAWLLMRKSEADLNVRGAFLHMLADAGVSFAVILAAAGIWLTGWKWLDPAVGLLISAVILFGTWSLLRDSLRLSLDAAPKGIDPDDVRRYLEGLPEVAAIHDLHIWAMSTTETALTCHLVTPRGHPGDAFLHRIAAELLHEFAIGHTTVQIELNDAGHCALQPDEVV
ncbi:MAG TPA: cation diffusion facilitator family transporter [Pseudolabrys sp.]|nr:cation diffusion facilitator family transporter [Pseudolabrys sp.]